MRSVASVVIVLAAAVFVVPPIHAQLLTEADAATLPVAGTPVHVTPRNTFDRPLVVNGLQDRTPGADGAPAPRDSVVVAPGGTAEVRFTPRTPGAFAYPARVVGIGGVTPGLGGGVPAEPGNWIFHCHFMRHMSPLQTAPLTGNFASHASGCP